MKYALIILIILHGLIHLMGFAKAFQLAELSQLKKPISKLMGVIWLLSAILLVFGGVSYILEYSYAWLLSGSGLVLSQVLVLRSWSDAKIGTVANVILLPFILTSFGVWNFEREVELRVKDLIPLNYQEELLNDSSLRALPSLVQLWLHNSGISDQPMTYYAKLWQSGEMKSSPEGEWTPFTAVHWTSMPNPGFVWHARMEAGPGMHVGVMDQFLDGKGAMLVKLQSLITLNNVTGPEIDEGAMQRYLAEMVWTPSFVLSPYIQWEQLDNVRIKVSMNYHGINASVIYTFNARGMVKQIEAQRYYYQENGSNRETWVVTMDESSYKSFNGIYVPARSTITWKLKEGDYTWFRMEISDIQFNSK